MAACSRSSAATSASSAPIRSGSSCCPLGEPVQLTNVRGNKYGPAFSGDGSRVAFTVASPHPDWETFTVSSVGGDTPQLLLRNAAGLTWIDGDHILFSEIRRGDAHGHRDQPCESFRSPRALLPAARALDGPLLV